MGRYKGFTLGTLLTTIGIMLAASVTPALGDSPARKQRFDGAIVTSGATGSRQVVTSVIVGSGVFNGRGRIVERDNLPGDPDNVSRDDLVFKKGTLSIISTDLDSSFSVDPTTCLFVAKVSQKTSITHGTGLFTHARGKFDARVDVHGLAQRDPDGSCSETQAPLFELDVVSAHGTLKLKRNHR